MSTNARTQQSAYTMEEQSLIDEFRNQVETSENIQHIRMIQEKVRMIVNGALVRNNVQSDHGLEGLHYDAKVAAYQMREAVGKEDFLKTLDRLVQTDIAGIVAQERKGIFDILSRKQTPPKAEKPAAEAAKNTASGVPVETDTSKTEPKADAPKDNDVPPVSADDASTLKVPADATFLDRLAIRVFNKFPPWVRTAGIGLYKFLDYLDPTDEKFAYRSSPKKKK